MQNVDESETDRKRMRPSLDELDQRDLLSLAREACLGAGVTLAEAFSRDRGPGPSEARKRFYGSLRAQGWSFPRIGALVGRHHSTIMYALERIPEPVDTAVGLVSWV